MPKILISLALVVLLLACGDDGSPFERVNKLRALGVATSPLAVLPNTTVNLLFHLLVPVEKEVVAEALIDGDSVYSVPLKIELDQNSVLIKDYRSLRHYTISATMVIPGEDMLSFRDENQAARIRYAVKFTSDGEEEKVVGTVFVQRAQELQNFTDLTVDILRPVADERLIPKKEIDIEAAIGNPNDEPVKIGWFVSQGRIENRRAKETKWKTGDADHQLIVATVRGKRSRSFAIDILELRAE